MNEPQKGAICLVVTKNSPWNGEWGFIYDMKDSGRVGVMLNGKYKVQFGRKGVVCMLECTIFSSDEYEPYVRACKERNQFFKTDLSPEIMKHMEESEEWKELENPFTSGQQETHEAPSSSTPSDVKNLEKSIEELQAFVRQMAITVGESVDKLSSQLQSVHERVSQVKNVQPARNGRASPSLSETSAMSMSQNH